MTSPARPDHTPDRRPPTSRERRHARRRLERLNGETVDAAYERLAVDRHDEWDLGTPHVDPEVTGALEFALRRIEEHRTQHRATATPQRPQLRLVSKPPAIYRFGFKAPDDAA
jgi:hypothetical protein